MSETTTDTSTLSISERFEKIGGYFVQILSATGAINGVTSVVFKLVVEEMAVAEAEYEDEVDAGATKKAAVLAAVKATLVDMGIDFDDWDSVSDFIDNVKSAFNAWEDSVSNSLSAIWSAFSNIWSTITGGETEDSSTPDDLDEDEDDDTSSTDDTTDDDDTEETTSTDA